jgi:hypothetical protein
MVTTVYSPFWVDRMCPAMNHSSNPNIQYNVPRIILRQRAINLFSGRFPYDVTEKY